MQQQDMSWEEAEKQRPAKKRRFFVEDSPEKVPTQNEQDKENITAQDAAVIADEAQVNGAASAVTDTGFDASLLESVVGEKLKEDVVKKLRELSDGNIERGL